MIGPARRALRIFILVSVPMAGIGGQARLQGQGVGSSATVRGRVVEYESGTPLWGAAVSLADGPAGTRGVGTRVTGEEGSFLFREVPPGLYRLSVTRLGYADLRDTLRVEAGSDLVLTLPVSTSPIELEAIVVRSRRRSLEAMSGFESRRRSLSGTFITREEIEDRRPHRFTDLFRMVPGARVVPSELFGYRVTFRGGCVPTLVVDGIRIGPDAELDLYVQPSDVEAVEIYHGAAVPVQFGINSCGAIVVWTRPGEPVGDPEGFWRRALFAVGILTLTYLLTHR